MRKKYIAIIICIVFIALIVIFSNIFLVKTVQVVFEKQPLYANEQEIITASKIQMNTNIFSLDEQRIKKNIEEFYPNNTVWVADIQRKFPNDVKIFIKERTPLLIVPYGSEDSEEWIPTDIDFQMVERCNKDDIDFEAIYVSGIYVDTSFNLASFRQIKQILDTFLDLSFKQSSLIAFIKEIQVSDESISVILRNGDCVFEFDTKSSKTMADQTVELYNKYLALDYASRNVFHLTV